MKTDRQGSYRASARLVKAAASVAAICTQMLLGACAPKTVFVLLPEEDGKSGKITVTSKGGEQLLSQPGQATALASAEDAPSAPFVMSDRDIGEKFGDALGALPLRPLHFVLYFKTGTAELTPESEVELKKVYAAIHERKSTDISVVGHTDRVGKREDNFRLGMERTEQVKRLLVSQGIDDGLIDTASHGEDNPLVKTEDEVAEPRNRRVEVVVR